MSHAAFSINLRKINIVLILLLVVGAVTYFFTITNLSTKGFAFKELKEQSNALVIEKQHMESEITSLASYQSLDQRIKNLALVASKDVAYISWDDLVVARK
jgi:hypothetical protein